MAELSTLGHVIKAAYEGQPNTNAYTDPEKARVAALVELAMTGQWGHILGKPGVIAAGDTEAEARGMDTAQFPVASADTGIMGVSGGDIFTVNVMHNYGSSRNITNTGGTMINIELFESI